MVFGRYNNIITILVCIALLLTSCGGPTQNEEEIATAVALTVQAQNALTEVAALPTITLVPALENTLTPEPVTTNTPAAVSTNPGCDPAASLLAESPPDKTAFKPGAYFFKTWTFLNTGSCAWDENYKLVFWDGNSIGGSPSYNFLEYVLPGNTMDISIYMQAPETEGTYTGYWRLQTPWGDDFGVGQYDQSFYVEIRVSGKKDFGITNVTYELVREPQFGCPVNVEYFVYATVTVDGPYRFTYYWNQSDGNRSGYIRMIFTEAGSQTVKRRWLIGRGDSPNPRWVEFIAYEPDYGEYGKVTILNNCP